MFAVEGAEDRSESTDPEHAPSPMADTAVSTPSPTVRIRQVMSAPVRSLVDVSVLAGPTTVRVFADNSAVSRQLSDNEGWTTHPEDGSTRARP